MESFLILGLLVLVVFILSRGSGNKDKMGSLAEALDRLSEEISELRKDLGNIKSLGAKENRWRENEDTARYQPDPLFQSQISGLERELNSLREQLLREREKAAFTPSATEEELKANEQPEITIPEETREIPLPNPEPKQVIEPVSEPTPEPLIFSFPVVVHEPLAEPEPEIVPEPIITNRNFPSPEFPAPFSTEPEKVAEKVETPNEATAEPVTQPLYEPQPVAAFTQPAPEKKEPRPAYEPQESGYDRWLRNNPDLEKFIGENLINKIGIAILVLGIAFFVKYAIDQNWIKETGRVAIGLGCGAILVGVAHYLRTGYRSFSSVLAGGGIAVFYFTIAFAYHQYHLMGQTTSFVIMVIITAFAIALSVLYDRLELAIIAAIGGFITPFLVSNGEGNYMVLFTYLLILNCGLLSLAWFKRWPSINIIALAFTEVIFGGWLGDAITTHKPFSYPAALSFATAFYLIFLGMNMINQVKNKKQFKPFDFFLLLFISFTYFTGGMTILHEWNNGAYQGMFTLFIGLINLGLAWSVYKRGTADRNLLFLLIGLTLTFITLTIPIQLHGHAITMFWSAEFVLLFWLSGVSGIRLFKLSSLIVCSLAMISLFMDWNNAGIASKSALHLIYNDTRGLVTNLIAVAAFVLYYYFLRKNKDAEFLPGISNRGASRIALFVSVILLYTTCIFGINLIFKDLNSYAIPNVYYRMTTEIFALVLMILAQRSSEKVSPWWQLMLLYLSFIVYLFSSDLILQVRSEALEGKAPWVHMWAHWADSVLLGILFLKTIQVIRNNPEKFLSQNKALIISTSIMIIAFFSIELLHIYIITAYTKDNTEYLTFQYGKAGLTVIWGICSFAMMWLGMKHRQKVLRIFSLTLFSIVLLKLFIIDISEISEGGKILAFILLGVLLLVVSFMYQKLKKIIIDDKKE